MHRVRCRYHCYHCYSSLHRGHLNRLSVDVMIVCLYISYSFSHRLVCLLLLVRDFLLSFPTPHAPLLSPVLLRCLIAHIFGLFCSSSIIGLLMSFLGKTFIRDVLVLSHVRFCFCLLDSIVTAVFSAWFSFWCCCLSCRCSVAVFSRRSLFKCEPINRANIRLSYDVYEYLHVY